MMIISFAPLSPPILAPTSSFSSPPRVKHLKKYTRKVNSGDVKVVSNTTFTHPNPDSTTYKLHNIQDVKCIMRILGTSVGTLFSILSATFLP
jgi:hypothetical protein